MGAAEDLNRREQIRYHLLRRAHELTGGARDCSFNFMQLGQEAGFSPEETRLAMQYLIGEGLLKPRTLAGAVSITHQGVVEIENSIRKPNDPTDHFDPPTFTMVNNNTFNAPVGAVQHGAGSVANVTQNVSTNVSNDVKVLLTQLRDQVDQSPSETRDEATSMIGELEQEAGSATPTKWKVRALLAGLGTILSGTASNLLSDLAIKLLGGG